MFLGIEIGGTKLQLGVGAGDGSPFVAFERRQVEPRGGAAGILENIREIGRRMLSEHSFRAVGVGFGGPVDVAKGVVLKSHQIEGWEDIPLRDWCEKTFGRAAAVENDAETAGLAEAVSGAGRGARTVLYVTVGTGIGGGLVVDGDIYRGGGAGSVEIGHLRPHPEAPEITVEQEASGWGIVAAARRSLDAHRLAEGSEAAAAPQARDLLERCSFDAGRLTAVQVAAAARDGNAIAREAIEQALRSLGWAVAQCITILCPEVVVIGGGVSLMGERRFYQPVRAIVARYCFPPFRDAYRLTAPVWGEDVVVQGALAVARKRCD